MLPRIERLEDDMREVKADLKSLGRDMSDIKTQLAVISAKLDGKIDYKWMSIYVLGIVAVIMREEIVGWFK